MKEQIKILLVEDNEGDIILITEALESSPTMKIETIVKNGWEAMKCLEREAPYESYLLPDLILLDVNLPKLNGQEVLKRIKADKQLKHIPVIMLTTSSQVKDINEAYDNYASCFITKPEDVKDFEIVVKTIENFWSHTAQLPG